MLYSCLHFVRLCVCLNNSLFLLLQIMRRQAFHAALRAAHASFVASREADARALLRHHLDAATGEFALGLLVAAAPPLPQASGACSAELMPPPATAAAAPLGRIGGGGSGGGGADAENLPPCGGGEPDGDDDGGGGGAAAAAPARTPFRPSQMTVPETPSPGELQQQQAAGGGAAVATRRGGRQFVDNTPSKGRVSKAQRLQDPTAAAVAAAGSGVVAAAGAAALPSTYSEVLACAERLFGRVRAAVAGQAAPATLKAALLAPMGDELPARVGLELFARTDEDFMGMFTGEFFVGCGGILGGMTLVWHALCPDGPHLSPVSYTRTHNKHTNTAAGALQALQAKRDAAARRAEGLMRCKAEFQELARCL